MLASARRAGLSTLQWAWNPVTSPAMFTRTLLLAPLALSPFVRQDLRRYLSVAKHADLVVLKELVESGQLTPIIERTYTLEQTPEALRHIETGHARGKVVVRV